ncbi:type I-F CRISPR-associated endoribonuclease Cas6/Csy4 [Desulfobacterota bacterium M19]
MIFYQEISLLPGADISPYFLWQKLYQQIHLALVENKNSVNQSAIGVSFPDYNAAEYLLGTKLRLFAEDRRLLEELNCHKWLSRLSDYVQIGQTKSVPEKIEGYACFKHIKLKGNKGKLARRRARRKGESFQEALAHFDNYVEQHSKLPYINVVSLTNEQRFRLFIEKQVSDQPQTGFFSCYGLSNTTTVPLF